MKPTEKPTGVKSGILRIRTYDYIDVYTQVKYVKQAANLTTELFFLKLS